MSPTETNDVALNPPERKQRLSDARVAEISLAACAMPHDVPVAGWLGDLCADLFDARALLARVQADYCTPLGEIPWERTRERVVLMQDVRAVLGGNQ